jgi:hypothetical protein
MASREPKLIFPSPPQQAVSIDFDVILVLATVHGQKARDRCHRGETNDAQLTRVGCKYYNFAESEFMAHSLHRSPI